MLDEGKNKVFARHLECRARLVDGLQALGLKMLVEPASRLPMLNSVVIPEGVDDAKVHRALRIKHNIEIGGGLGSLAGKIWRIGTMGHTAWPENVDRILAALRSKLMHGQEALLRSA